MRVSLTGHMLEKQNIINTFLYICVHRMRVSLTVHMLEKNI
jgi:hypothetical protein